MVSMHQSITFMVKKPAQYRQIHQDPTLICLTNSTSNFMFKVTTKGEICVLNLFKINKKDLERRNLT